MPQFVMIEGSIFYVAQTMVKMQLLAKLVCFIKITHAFCPHSDFHWVPAVTVQNEAITPNRHRSQWSIRLSLLSSMTYKGHGKLPPVFGLPL